MSEIKFKLVKDEPVCNGECPRFNVEDNFNSPSECGLVCGEGDPCIPGLRQQRDDRERERDEARAVIERGVKKIEDLSLAFQSEVMLLGVLAEVYDTLLPAPATEGGEG